MKEYIPDVLLLPSEFYSLEISTNFPAISGKFPVSAYPVDLNQVLLTIRYIHTCSMYIHLGAMTRLR